MSIEGTKMRGTAMDGGSIARQGLKDADDIAAALLLRRVENLLREGQPRQAVAHICEMTGVERAQAEEFVAGLKASVFG
jgi:hypothetical protein